MGGLSAEHARALVERMLAEHRKCMAGIAMQSEALTAAAALVVATIDAGGKIMTCGNGGSAADAQHLTAELVGRFEGHTMSIPCLTLSADSSVVTALANDFGYDQVFAAQIAALGRSGDVLVAFSTSGTSPNMLSAVREAQLRGVAVVAVVGANAGPETIAHIADLVISAGSEHTPRIQEAHGLAVHALCELVTELRSR